MIAASSRLAALLALALVSHWPLVSTAQPADATQPRATVAPRELLNSERIEQEFGSYGIEVLHSDAALRVSNLYSETGDQRVGRTFAVVFYPAEVDPQFAAEHSAILDGGSIGAVFTSNDWTVTRRHLWFGRLASTARLAELMSIESAVPLAAHIYVLDVSKAGEAFEYAVIAEVHHPDYLRLDELPAIYGAAAFEQADQDPLLRRMLDATQGAMR